MLPWNWCPWYSNSFIFLKNSLLEFSDPLSEKGLVSGSAVWWRVNYTFLNRLPSTFVLFLTLFPHLCFQRELMLQILRSLRGSGMLIRVSLNFTHCWLQIQLIHYPKSIWYLLSTVFSPGYFSHSIYTIISKLYAIINALKNISKPSILDW